MNTDVTGHRHFWSEKMKKILTQATPRFGAWATLFALLPLSFMASAANIPTKEPVVALQFTTVAGAGGVPLSVVSAGDPSKPSILLVHGIGQSYVSWENQLRPPLTDQFHVVAYDLRGHGNSGKPWNKESYQDYRLWAGDVQAVITAMRLDHPVLVGWSYGTLVVADYLRAYGASGLRGIVLTGAYGGLTPPPPPLPPAKVALAARMELLRKQQGSGNIEDNIAAAESFSHLLTGRELAASYYIRATQISMMLPGYARRWMFDRSLANADVVSKITVPLLITVGGKDSNTPESDARDLAAKVANARISVYPESGHSPFAEDPERYSRELAEFARK
jgi:pimeloyl-ACP methyl ester carboxylesterase